MEVGCIEVGPVKVWIRRWLELSPWARHLLPFPFQLNLPQRNDAMYTQQTDKLRDSERMTMQMNLLFEAPCANFFFSFLGRKLQITSKISEFNFTGLILFEFYVKTFLNLNFNL